MAIPSPNDPSARRDKLIYEQNRLKLFEFPNRLFATVLFADTGLEGDKGEYLDSDYKVSEREQMRSAVIMGPWLWAIWCAALISVAGNHPYVTIPLLWSGWFLCFISYFIHKRAQSKDWPAHRVERYALGCVCAAALFVEIGYVFAQEHRWVGAPLFFYLALLLFCQTIAKLPGRHCWVVAGLTCALWALDRFAIIHASANPVSASAWQVEAFTLLVFVIMGQRAARDTELNARLNWLSKEIIKTYGDDQQGPEATI